MLHVVRRDLSAVRDPLSFYASGAWGWLFAAGCVAFAAALALLAVAARRALFVLPALCLLVVAAFPTDPWMPWDRAPTPVGAVHSGAVVVLLLALTVGAPLISRPGLSRVLALAIGVLLAVTVAAVLVTLRGGGAPGFVGLAERAVLVVAAAWTADVAARVPKRAHRGPAF